MTPAELTAKLRIPVIGSPMFIVSGPELVIAQCKAGIVGSFPALNARPRSQLGEWLDRITTELADHDAKYPDAPAAPFAVNQIVHKTNDRLDGDMELCVKYRAPIVITSLGAREEINQAAHSYGGMVMHDVINRRFSEKALEKGADGLIAVCAGAGGHAGRLSPMAFVQEIRSFFDGPLALSGAIANGGAVLAAQAMGADFAYVGSAFIATHEANAVDAYKDGIVQHGAEDIVKAIITCALTGVLTDPRTHPVPVTPAELAASAKRGLGGGRGLHACAFPRPGCRAGPPAQLGRGPGGRGGAGDPRRLPGRDPELHHRRAGARLRPARWPACAPPGPNSRPATRAR
jgi:nitronate monooxygenase